MSDMGRFAIWAQCSDPSIDAALKQLAEALHSCKDRRALSGMEQRLGRMGSSAAAHENELADAEQTSLEATKVARAEKTKRERERRQKKLLDTPLSSLIAGKLSKRARPSRNI